MTRYDEVRYHGRPCVVEDTWDDDQGHHMAALRPLGADGVYMVDQADCDES